MPILSLRVSRSRTATGGYQLIFRGWTTYSRVKAFDDSESRKDEPPGVRLEMWLPPSAPGWLNVVVAFACKWTSPGVEDISLDVSKRVLEQMDCTALGTLLEESLYLISLNPHDAIARALRRCSDERHLHSEHLHVLSLLEKNVDMPGSNFLYT